MKITRLKINGMENPVGFSMRNITVSWHVVQAAGMRAELVTVQLAKDAEFEKIITEKQGKDLPCTGVSFDVSLAPRTTYFVRVSVIDEVQDSAEAVTTFETGKASEAWSAKWIAPDEDTSFHPVFRKEIDADKEIGRARLYICGLGLYEVYINEEKIGREFLTPYLSDYNSALQVQTYDITDMITEHNNLEVMLGDGWYKGIYGEAGGEPYGKEFALIAEIHITYQDGSEKVITTDESWHYRGSKIEESSIYGGEIYNRNLWEDRDNSWKKVRTTVTPCGELIDRYSLPVHIKEELSVKEILHTPAGETVLDMGQNFTGWVTFHAKLPKGTRVHLEFGEVMQQENFYNDNYRTAKGGFIYISDGEEEWVRPHFTFFGFRYVKVSGWIGELQADRFKGCVLYSDLERTGYLETGNEKINRLYENSLWGLKSNFLDIPTDCPQRDERLGWTGDAQVFSTTASYHMDTRAFYRKYLWDLRNEQLKRGGGVPAYAPSPGSGPINLSAAVWGDAAAIIPDVCMRMYGDRRELEQYYPMMRDWVDYVGREIEKVHGKKAGLWDFGFQFGDWLALDGPDEQSFKGDTPDDYIATIYYYHSVQIVADSAEELDKQEDARFYRSLERELRQLILDHYFTPVGHLSASTQASYIAAMKFKVYRDLDILTADFMKLFQKHGNKIKCGFVGAPLICQTLAEIGQVDTAYNLLFVEEYPSWLYAVNLGATTIWERWNSLLPDGTISGTDMNSLNHYSYGSIVEFLYAYTAGIRPAEAGFRKAVIAPVPHGKLRSCNCTYHSNAGTYVVNWKISRTGQLQIHLEIPFGCSAVVRLPQYEQKEFELTAGKYDYNYQPAADYRQKYNSTTTLNQIFADPEAAAIIRQIIPASSYLEGSGGASIGDLIQLSMLGITEEMVRQLIDELKQLTYF